MGPFFDLFPMGQALNVLSLLIRTPPQLAALVLRDECRISSYYVQLKSIYQDPTYRRPRNHLWCARIAMVDY